MEFNHDTVLLAETIDSLDVIPNGTYVDCTLGGAGHTGHLLSQLNELGKLYAFDQDQTALDYAQKMYKDEIETGKLVLIKDNFRNIRTALQELGVKHVDGIYYDLGVSSPQLDVAERGFSYNKDAKLDMRMNQEQELTAYEVVNMWSFNDLVRIISRYGEERFAKRIARAIEENRDKAPIESTLELSEIVKAAIPAATRRTGGHPAKRTFQAIRIAVNDELGALEDSLQDGVKLLKVGGRMSVITFHSLEDRLVKQYFRELSSTPETPPNMPMIPDHLKPEYRMVSRKPIVASEEELQDNNRARSARLRTIERIRIKD